MNNPVDFDALWNFNDPAETEKRFRELLPGEGQPLFETDWHWELLLQIARTQGLQRQFDEAHATLDLVDAKRETASPRVAVRHLLERGRVFNSSKQRDKAGPLIQSAWELAQNVGEEALAVDAAHMLAIVAPAEESLEWNQKALVLAEASDDPRARKWAGSLNNNIGWTHHGNGDFQTALEHFQKAVVCRQEQNEPGEIQVARWCVARCLRSLGQIHEALAIQQELQIEHEAAGTGDGYVFEELAECQLALEMPEAAQINFSIAYHELSKDDWLVENEAERIARLKSLGGVE